MPVYDNVKIDSGGWSPDEQFADWLHTEWHYPTTVDEFLPHFFGEMFPVMSRGDIAYQMQQAMTTNIGVIMPQTLKDELIQRGFLSP